MRIWTRSLLAFVFLLSAGLFAQQRALISEIRFQGLSATKQNDALNAIQLRPGDIFADRDLNQAIKDLTAMQRFKNVSASTRTSPGGVSITFTVEEEALLARVVFRGVGLTKQSKVKPLNDLVAGRAFRDAKARAAVYKIKEYYVSEGYLDADVQYEITPVKLLPGYFDLVYTVAEGPKITVRDIQFRGAVKIKPRKLAAAMKVKKRMWIFQSGVLKEDEFLADKERILAVYKKSGYFDAEITNYKWAVEDIATSNKSGEVTKVTRGIRIVADIVEGEQYATGSFSFEGNKIVTIKELEKFLTMKEGETYDQEKIDAMRTAIYKKYSDNGFLYANVSLLQTKRAEGRVVDTVFVITEGKRSHINNIIITGNTRTYPSVIRHLIQVSEGELYVNRKLEQSFNRLGQTQFFSDVRILPQPSATDGLIDLEFIVTEGQTGQIELNAGWGTVSGFLVGARVAEKNLGGRGWYLGVKGEYGQYRQLGEITFTNPFLFLSPFSFSVTFGVDNTRYINVPTDENRDGVVDGTSLNYIANPKATLASYVSDQEYTRLNFKAGFSFGVQFWVYWNAAVGFDFNIFRDYKQNFTNPLFYDNGWKTDTELIYSFTQKWTIQNTVFLNLSYNNTDGGLWPTRGIRTSLYVGFSGAGLGGNIHYIALAYSFDFYFKLFSIPSFGKELKVTWVFHYDMGFILPYTNGLFVYRDANRLYFDGVYKMRGWINTVTRGEALSYFSMELRVPVWEFIGLVGFMDIGSNVARYSEFSWNTSKYIMSLGLGLAVNLPVLPIRLYVARPFEWRDGTFKPTVDGNFWKNWQFVFSVQGLF